jgi:hypothetical protein
MLICVGVWHEVGFFFRLLGGCRCRLLALLLRSIKNSVSFCQSRTVFSLGQSRAVL